MLCLRWAYFISSATTKAAVHGYLPKAASFCFAVILACLSLFLTSLPHIPLNFYLPVAQCQVSLQGLCVLILNMLGYELLFSLGTL